MTDNHYHNILLMTCFISNVTDAFRIDKCAVYTCMYVSWSDVSSAFNSPPSFSACLVVVPVAGRLLFLLMWGISNNYFILASGKDGVFFVIENNKM